MSAAPDWISHVPALKLAGDALINGRFVDSDVPRRIVVGPRDGRRLGEVADCTATQINAAVGSARGAFASRVWCGMSAADRKRRMQTLADLIDKHARELALIETLNVGKPIHYSFGADVPKSANCIRWFGELMDKLDDEIPATRPTAMALVTREPVGVVGLITPWNYPLYLGVVKLAPALAMGNSVVLKPSEYTPFSSLRLAELAVEADIPPGVFNVVPGAGAVAGAALAEHGDVDTLAFTGSTPVGGLLLQAAGRSNNKRVSLECGGKSPHVVFEDCGNLDSAAKSIAAGIFYNQGEVCNAGSRVIVHENVREALLERLIAHSGEYQPGDPLDERTRMGALIHEQHLAKVLGYVEAGTRAGAKLVQGGTRARTETGGYYMNPTIFDRVTPQMSISREEIFGPVLGMTTFKTAEEAIALANDTEFGLAAGVWTRDVSRAHRVAKQLHAGSVWVNSFNVSDVTVPFGGFKRSGYGKDKSRHALEKYSELKMTWIELD